MMVRPVQSPLERQRAYLARKKGDQVALPCPWAWLGIKGAQTVLTQAYRTATWTNRHQTGELSTEDLTDQEMRQFFVESLAADFAEALMAAAVESGECWPNAVGYGQRFKALQADVDPAWRPEYPQFRQVPQ